MTENLTQRVALFAEQTRWENLTQDVCHEAKRSLLNCIATAISGSAEAAIDKSFAVLAPYSSTGVCTLIGRRQTADAPLAAYLNAMSANVFDFDDTHQKTVIHPTAPIAPALLAWSQVVPCTGKELITAFVVGGEITCRTGNAVSPSHYSRGWHITSTCGVFGAAAGVGRLLGLDADQHVAALANASVQSAGLVETLGTMSKSISVGNAARNGMLSALLAREGYGGPPDPLAGDRGFLAVYAEAMKPDELLSELGERWEIATNTYKPYPAGIVLHPVIEACIQLYNSQGLRSEDVEEVRLSGHPLLRQRADRPQVSTGRLSQVSAQHAIAIALRRGQAGLAEFSDEAVTETLRDGIRPRVVFIDDASRAVDSVLFSATTVDGQRCEFDITCAKGGSLNPMSDTDLEAKLDTACAYRGLSLDCGAIADAVWSLDAAENAAGFMPLLSA